MEVFLCTGALFLRRVWEFAAVLSGSSPSYHYTMTRFHCCYLGKSFVKRNVALSHCPGSPFTLQCFSNLIPATNNFLLLKCLWTINLLFAQDKIPQVIPYTVFLLGWGVRGDILSSLQLLKSVLDQICFFYTHACKNNQVQASVTSSGYIKILKVSTCSKCLQDWDHRDVVHYSHSGNLCY